MSRIMYIGSFAQLLKATFGDTIREDFIEDNLPSLSNDYEHIKNVSPNICSELNYEYVDGQACIMFVNKWRKILKKYNKEHSDFFNPYKNPLSAYDNVVLAETGALFEEYKKYKTSLDTDKKESETKLADLSGRIDTLEKKRGKQK